MNSIVQYITVPDGEDLAVLTRRDYEALLARAGDAAAEDAMTARILIETAADVAIPESVWTEIERGTKPLRAVRKWRGLTQVQLAEAVGVSQGYIAGLEGTDGKHGSPAVWRKLGKALGVTVDTLTDEGAD